MINIIDLIVGILVIFYLLRGAGGIVRTLKTLVFILLALMFFGIVAQLTLDLSFAKPVHKTLRDSYSVKVSHVLIKWFYPVVRQAAPKIDSFIKKKILSTSTPEVSVPKIVLPEKSLPKLSFPEELPKLK